MFSFTAKFTNIAQLGTWILGTPRRCLLFKTVVGSLSDSHFIHLAIITQTPAATAGVLSRRGLAALIVSATRSNLVQPLPPQPHRAQMMRFFYSCPAQYSLHTKTQPAALS